MGKLGNFRIAVSLALHPRADEAILYLTNGNGNGPSGSTKRLPRSRDGSRSYEDAGLPGPLSSTPWCVAVNLAEPTLVFVCTNLGLMLRSDDGRETWIRLRRKLGKIRLLPWRPLCSPQKWKDTWVCDGRF